MDIVDGLLVDRIKIDRSMQKKLEPWTSSKYIKQNKIFENNSVTNQITHHNVMDHFKWVK